jgi:hypothetical protein
LANVEIDIGKSKDINLNQNKEDKKGKKCCWLKIIIIIKFY